MHEILLVKQHYHFLYSLIIYHHFLDVRVVIYGKQIQKLVALYKVHQYLTTNSYRQWNNQHQGQAILHNSQQPTYTYSQMEIYLVFESNFIKWSPTGVLGFMKNVRKQVCKNIVVHKHGQRYGCPYFSALFHKMQFIILPTFLCFLCKTRNIYQLLWKKVKVFQPLQ